MQGRRQGGWQDAQVRGICMGRDPPGPNKVSRMHREETLGGGQDAQAEATHRKQDVCVQARPNWDLMR